jgi:tRNA uridine 5-carboxymethylaminomethyl modification enzyme
MWKNPLSYDVIVVGAGHAGCEAARIAARMGCRTLLLTMNVDTPAKMSCNPSIGGTAKGHIVREIDALGGIMGKLADQTGIHFRMLNSSKGPSVHSPRAQVDKQAYSFEMKHLLEKTPNLFIHQAMVTSFSIDQNRITGVFTREGVCFQTQSVVLCSGTFLRGILHIGHLHFPGGRGGESSAEELSLCLKEIGCKLGRLKTGTPPRIHRRSIDFSKMEEQKGEEEVYFSYDVKEHLLPQVSCFITYSTEETRKVILRDLKKSALFGGMIQGVGPRYCPSIEDKMVRFADKERHQIFLEPEGIHTEEFYVNGLSSSMPQETQQEVIHSILGLENAEVIRPSYAIEYDYLQSGQLLASLESKTIQGLFFAGQINGTTGYEEAAGQGLVAGINAALLAKGKPPLHLNRSESYLGVMIDDLVSKDLDEPYRMFTSRAEHRLLLRQDNADLRLREIGFSYGLISEEQIEKVRRKKKHIEEEILHLSQTIKNYEGKSLSLAQVLCRPEMTYQTLFEVFPSEVRLHDKETHEQIEITLKYRGYIDRQNQEVSKLKHLEKILIPKGFAFGSVGSLRHEAKEKFLRYTPSNLAQALRLPGISPADISLLLVALKKSTLTYEHP